VFSSSNVGSGGRAGAVPGAVGHPNQTTIFSNTKDKYYRAQFAYDTTFFFTAAASTS
jgi:hypothetical protein